MAARTTHPTRRLLDASTPYTSSAATDIRQTFARARKDAPMHDQTPPRRVVHLHTHRATVATARTDLEHPDCDGTCETPADCLCIRAPLRSDEVATPAAGWRGKFCPPRFAATRPMIEVDASDYVSLLGELRETMRWRSERRARLQRLGAWLLFALALVAGMYWLASR